MVRWTVSKTLVPIERPPVWYTGSTVGAGILALPSIAAPAGFLPSAATMVACWVLLAAEALLLADINLAVRIQKVPTWAVFLAVKLRLVRNCP